jgi:predicted alpha/beta superfamily hydrolase
MNRRHAAALSALSLVACTSGHLPRPSTARPNVQVLADRFTIPSLQRERTIRLYLPPSYATQPSKRYPVLYLHDGQNLFDDATAYAGEWGVDEALNALATSTGFEAIVVGIDNGGVKRMNELNPWPHERFGVGEGEAYLNFIVQTIKPHIDARFRTRSDAASTLIGGSSMGGLISHAGIVRHPSVFSKALVFSPSYWTAPAMAVLAEQQPLPRSARVYFYAGGQESESMAPLAERMHALVQGQGTATTLRVVAEAKHNEAAWRAEFERAVRWLFELPAMPR